MSLDDGFRRGRTVALLPWVLWGALLLPWVGLGSGARAEPTAASSSAASAGALPAGEEVARRINARDEGRSFFSVVRMELTDASGQQRLREIRTLRRELEGERQTVFVFDAPKDVRGTGLLVHDYGASAREDQQWLYLPAARRVRRIAAGDRGGYFAGTDFSYDDMKNGSKVNVADYRWSTLRGDAVDGEPCYVVQAEAVSEDVAQETGYGRILFWVDGALWMTRRAEIFDPRGQPLKTIESRDIRPEQGIPTAHVLDARNLQTGHRTVLTLQQAQYDVPVRDAQFTERSLERGLGPLP
jgi:hypothetical protein